MSLSIKKRIYYSFSILASIFIINGIIIVATLSQNDKLSKHISEDVDPFVQSLNEFKLMLISSREYSINWVFLRSNQEYKTLLKEIQNSVYPALKAKLNASSEKWDNPQISDSINNMFHRFEELMIHEKLIMNTLSKFEDYDDPVNKFAAEEILENEVIPHTNSILGTLKTVIEVEYKIKAGEEKKLATSARYMRIFISTLVIIIIGLAVFLSVYMGRIIVQPITSIINIVNDLGRGVINKFVQPVKNDEIGAIILSVNNLSEKLHSSALFAGEIGNRNFNTEFVPLSEEDKLGKALIAMRNNLKSSDENLNEAQHIARLGSWERNLVLDTLVWSDELFKIFDLDSSTFTPEYDGYLSFIHEDDIEYVKKFYTRYQNDLQPFNYECRIVTPLGNKKIISVEGKVSANEYGKVCKTYGIVQDITIQKQSQFELENAHRQMQTLFSNIDEVFFSVDMIENKLLQISPACMRVYGFDESKFYENPDYWYEMVLNEDKQIINDNYEVMQSGQPFTNEYRIWHSDKSIHWLETRITPTMDKKGKLIRIDGITADITERKNSEIALRESREQIQTIYNASLDAIIITDEEGRIVKWDSKSESLFGWTENEVLGTYLSDSIIPHQHREAYTRGMKHFLNTDSGSVLGTTIEVRALNKDNVEFDISLSIAPSMIKDKYQFIGFIRDITERKKAEQILENQNNELKKTNSELDKFVYSVSHDLRAPLSSMLGVVEISEEDTQDELLLSHLDMLKGSIKKLDGFISDILDYSRNSRIEVVKEEINFNEMIIDITSHLKYMGGNNRSVAVNVDINNSVPFSSDKGRLSIIINNLVSNAIRYQNPAVPDPFVNIKVDTSDTETNIIIKDNGIGISKEMHEKIFDMFYRVSEESVGSGLGLYIVQESINKLKGHIEIESELGKGTTFNIHIPNN